MADLPPPRELIARAPKVLLHDHLDGGLRPRTVVELAAEAGHPLPSGDADGLERWFLDSAGSGSLERYRGENWFWTPASRPRGPGREARAR